LAAAGCAPETAHYAPSLFGGDPSTVTETAPASRYDGFAASADTGDWLNRTYVYRGGRDPKTGLARTQL
jgi:hypothetical protein